MADDALVVAFRRARPVSLRATLADGQVRELAPPGGKRKRWSQTVELLDRMAWVQLELLNAKGQTIDVVENDQAGEIEDIPDAPSTGTIGAATQIARLVLHGQDVALKRHSEMVRQLIDANLRLCNVLMGRVESLEKGHAANIKLAEKYARKLADGADDDDLLSSGPIEALLPLLLPRLLGGAPPAPPPPPPLPEEP